MQEKPIESFLDILRADSSTAPELLALAEQVVVPKTITKGTILQHPGILATKGYYVCKGLLRSYTIDHKGKEHIFMFASEGWLMSDLGSHALAEPSELYIDALEDTVVEVLDRKVLEHAELKETYGPDQVKRLMRRIAVLQKRVIMLMSATAAERYQHFTATYPDLVGRVPQRLIASYLGVTPEALSKIRGDLIRKDAAKS